MRHAGAEIEIGLWICAACDIQQIKGSTLTILYVYMWICIFICIYMYVFVYNIYMYGSIHGRPVQNCPDPFESARMLARARLT